MRSATWLATLVVGFVPLAAPAQQPAAQEAPPQPPAAQADPAPPAQAQPTAPVQAQPTPAPQPPAPPPPPLLAPPAQPGFRPPPTQARRGQPGQPGWPGPRRRTAAGYARAGGMAGPPRSVAFRPHGPPVKGAFLGVGASPAQEALRKQLQLKPGVGLVVDSVEGGSPAEQAGLREFDVLHKLDDQLLVNPEQFSVLVRTYKPGDEVKLTVIREGKPQVLAAKLGERELAPLGGVPGEFGLNIINVGDGELGVIHALPNVPQLVPGAAYDPHGGGVVLVAPGGETINAQTVLVQDDQHKLTISSARGRKHLRAEDKAGKIVFDGPIESAEELGKVPTDVRDKILKMGLLGINLPAATTPPAEAPGAPRAADPAATPSTEPGGILRLPQPTDAEQGDEGDEGDEAELLEF